MRFKKLKLGLWMLVVFLIVSHLSHGAVFNTNVTTFVPFNETSGTIARDYIDGDNNFTQATGTCTATSSGRTSDGTCYMGSAYSQDWNISGSNQWLFAIDFNWSSGTSRGVFSGNGNTSPIDVFLTGFNDGGGLTTYASNNGATWSPINNKGAMTLTSNVWRCEVIEFNGTHYLWDNETARFDSLSSTAKLSNWPSPNVFRAQNNNGFVGQVRNILMAKDVSWTSAQKRDWCANHTLTSLLTPTITLNRQIPADINLSNIFLADINITYNSSSVNRSLIRLFWKANSSDDGCGYHINGVSYCGWFNKTFKSVYNTSGTQNTTEFSLNPDVIIPGTYNLDPQEMDNVQNLNVSVGSNNAFVKNRFYNVSPTSQYFSFETYVVNQSAQPLHLWYCNSSYTTGSVSSSPYCYNFQDVAVGNYSHCHSNYSCHYVVPLNVLNNATNGIGVTDLSYILYQGGTQWNYFYTNNNTGSVQGTINGGTSWSNLGVTLNAHIHQYSNTTTLYYYAYDGTTQSSTNTDTIDSEAQPPSSVVILTPTAGTYDNTLIVVNFTNATLSLNSGNISSYIAILYNNATSSIVSTTLLGLNNSKNFNSTTIGDGVYYFDVQAYSTTGLYSDSFSEVFTISNSVPVIQTSTADAIEVSTNKLMFILLLFVSAIAYFLSLFEFKSGKDSAPSFFLKIMAFGLCILSYTFAPSDEAKNLVFALGMILFVINLYHLFQMMED